MPPGAAKRLVYLELALLPKVHVRIRDRQRFSVYAGMTGGYEIGGDESEAFDDFQYGPGIGIMWDYDSDGLNTRIDLRYTTSLNDSWYYDPESSAQAESVQNEAVTLSIGLTPGSRRARAQRALESGSPNREWNRDVVPGEKVRVDLSDGSRMDGLFVAYQPGTLTLVQQPTRRRMLSRRGEKPDSVSAAPVEERQVTCIVHGVRNVEATNRAIQCDQGLHGAIVRPLAQLPEAG